jgi:hypothetical protein
MVARLLTQWLLEFRRIYAGKAHFEYFTFGRSNPQRVAVMYRTGDNLILWLKMLLHLHLVRS